MSIVSVYVCILSINQVIPFLKHKEKLSSISDFMDVVNEISVRIQPIKYP